MPLFFFLSGCVLSVDKPYKEIIKKKVKQLLLPYVFFILLSCCFYWMLLLLSHRFTINHLWSLVDLFPYDNEIINTPLWFLVSLFWMSIIYSGIRKCVPQEGESYCYPQIGHLYFVHQAWKSSSRIQNHCGYFLVIESLRNQEGIVILSSEYTPSGWEWIGRY